MNLIGAYNDYQKNAERMAFFSFNVSNNDEMVKPLVSEAKEVKENKSKQDIFQSAEGLDMQEVSWGRVTQKENTSSMSSQPFMCAYVEKPTAVELFEKDRAMDRRSVEERSFTGSGKVIDFTV